MRTGVRVRFTIRTETWPYTKSIWGTVTRWYEGADFVVIDGNDGNQYVYKVEDLQEVEDVE